MKRTRFALRLSLALLVCLGAFTPSAIASGKNDCKDRCKDRYNLRKDICKAIPLKRQRHSCEDAAKHVRDQCKRNCR